VAHLTSGVARKRKEQPLCRTGRAVAFAVLLWIVGFAWGSIVFMTPSLKATPPIPFISTNPWISFPILLAWLPLAYFLARNCLVPTSAPASEGLKLGLVFVITNVVLDLVVLVVVFKTGLAYFASLTVIAGYALLLLVPWVVGRSLREALRR
jgi:hypothetical protein